MVLTSFRIRYLACLLLAIPLAAIPILGWPQDKPRSKEYFTNSLEMKLALIPAGKFMMGWPESEKSRSPNEKQHEVHIKEPFYLGIHEVRIRDYRAFVEDDGFKTEAEKAGDKDTWKNALLSRTEDHPVSYVSWNDAQAFCAWLTKKEGKKYRLPTEAEWEYACRAGTKTRYCSGDDVVGLKEFANFGYYTTTPVGQFKPNAFGLFDMHGNVYEWCEDLFKIKGDSYRVFRGGSYDWCDYPESCASASRGADGPSKRHDWVGFRVARDSSGAK
jgi:formylglycine-generating enzyme required for sulfatase activity